MVAPDCVVTGVDNAITVSVSAGIWAHGAPKRRLPHRAIVRFHLPDASGYKTLTVFDNIRLTVVPEPGSMLLLVLGMIGIGWKRRGR
jgi:PEP-CTERM motif